METTLQTVTAKIQEILPTATRQQIRDLARYMMTERQLTCLRCNGKWWSHTPALPKTCAKCNSPYWNKPRMLKK